METVPREVKVGDRWERVRGEPRLPGMGALIPRRLTEGESFFHLNGFLLCDERGREFLERGQYTNVAFLEAGELVE
jgi:hypothetical protein